MDALCVSVIPNYWTLPFKASLRCISHFCLSDWWRAGSDWGHCVLNTASVVIHYLLQIQHTAAAAAASFSAPLFHYNFLDLYSFSCSVIECIVSMCSGLLWCDAKRNEITYHVFLKKCSKLQKYTAGNAVFRGEAALWYRAVHAYNTYGWRLLEIASTLKLIAIVVINSRTFFLKGCWDGLRLTKRCNEIKIQDNTKCSQCLLNNDGTLNITVCLQKCSKCGLFIVRRCLHFVFTSVQTFSPLAFLDLWKMLLTGRHGEMVTVPTVLRSALLLLE